MQQLRPDERVRRRADFELIYKRGLKAHGRFSTVFLLPNGRAKGRLGIAATKKIGGAVRRNRAKRLVREIFRRNKLAPGYDVVIVPKRDLFGATLEALEAEYGSLLSRMLRRR